ncbi:hypothetical protein EC558_07385 [Helicobacter pylori]|nr:hypothetical protein EC558_07385 [Helicobacter pylori]
MKTHFLLLAFLNFKIRYNHPFNVFIFSAWCYSSLLWFEALKTDPLFLSDRIIQCPLKKRFLKALIALSFTNSAIR